MTAQQGPVRSPRSKIKAIDVEVSWAGGWVSLHDGVRFQVHPDGFGKRQYTKRRRKVASELFSGEYTVSETEDNLAQTLSVWIIGRTQMDLLESIDLLVKMFSQEGFMIRTRINETRETLVASGSADVLVDTSHVYLHNMRALATCTFATLPGVETEMIL